MTDTEKLLQYVNDLHNRLSVVEDKLEALAHPNRCPVCHEDFSNDDALMQHQRAKHH